MPKKKTLPSVVEEPKKENPDIAGALNQLASAIRQLEKKMSDGFSEIKKETKIESVIEPVIEPVYQNVTKNLPEVTTSATPFPVEWSVIINEVLNRRFKASVNYLPTASFELTVFVPKEYSNATKQEWEMNKCDRRIKIIPNYEGEQGVRMFIENVAKQLGQEIRAKINDDRAKLVNI